MGANQVYILSHCYLCHLTNEGKYYIDVNAVNFQTISVFQVNEVSKIYTYCGSQEHLSLVRSDDTDLSEDIKV